MQQTYLTVKNIDTSPRLPLKGSIDLTYRCNNNCRHCWLRIPADAKEKEDELTFEEMKNIVENARQLGCRSWAISGGEPMLRPDFTEIFDYITGHSASYTLNTNGTLITPNIARLMKRKGTKMVALCGATADVHDHITRNPDSFEATMRGLRYLKDAGAGFTVQLIPMKDNYRQWNKMVELAQSLSKHYRVGAPWLYLSSSGDPKINREILRQRLSPKEVVEFDRPDLSYEDGRDKKNRNVRYRGGNSGHLFSSCVAARRDFHIDPYGKGTFCCFIKDPELRYDLRKGTFKECWEEFIPSVSKKVKATKEYQEHCGSCDLRNDCRWCVAFGYLEHRRFGARVKYLCDVAEENKRFKEDWLGKHRRYYGIADITVRVDSDLPITEDTFDSKFKKFEVKGPGEDIVAISHHFSLPDLDGNNLGKEVYRKPPWAIYKKDDSWIYLGLSPEWTDKSLHTVAVFDSGHTRAMIYNDKEETFLEGGLHSLTLFPTDQIFLARVLADRQGCFLHACGVNFGGKGLLFAGHPEAGKSTMATMLQDKAEILCDDRIIVRRRPEGFKIYGTWSHGDVPDISSGSAFLKAVMFLEKSEENRVIPLENKKDITRRLLSCLIRPLVTVDWWEKTLALIGGIAREVPCYMLRFDKSGKVVDLLHKLLQG